MNKKLPSLPELQRDFADAIFGEGSNQDLAGCVLAAGLSSTRRLQIYRNNVFASLGGALEGVYPVVRALVGEDFFRACVREFVPAHPSRSGDIHKYGDRFADWLRDYPPAAQLAYLPDTAALEWAYHEAFHAPDAGALNAAHLAQVDEADHGRIRFQLHPSARLLQSPWPVLRIWQVNQEDFAGEPRVDLGLGGVNLLVLRRSLDIEFQPLGPGEYALLNAFAHDATLDTASTAALDAEAAFELPATLEKHVARGTLADFVV